MVPSGEPFGDHPFPFFFFDFPEESFSLLLHIFRKMNMAGNIFQQYLE
jgi:hypothetical protein